MSLLELFCHVDTFCQTFLPHWDQELRAHGQRTRRRSGQLAMSEIITILVYFHQMRFRDFKTYYLGYVLGHLHGAARRQLSTFRGTHARYGWSALCLRANLLEHL